MPRKFIRVGKARSASGLIYGRIRSGVGGRTGRGSVKPFGMEKLVGIRPFRANYKMLGIW